MTNFSPDIGGQGAQGGAKSQAPARFSPRQGNIGQRAAERALKGGVTKERGAGTSLQSGSPRGEKHELGHPSFGPTSDFQGQDDLRHLDLYSQHYNMQKLGRDVPFAVWALLNNAHQQFRKPGQVPFDVLEDVG